METPDLESIGDSPSAWLLINDEVYSRDLSGKEVAFYVNGDLMQNNIWGLGNEGYITISGALNFYLKDHLGSVRAVIDENNSVISSQDGACPVLDKFPQISPLVYSLDNSLIFIDSNGADPFVRLAILNIRSDGGFKVT